MFFRFSLGRNVEIFSKNAFRHYSAISGLFFTSQVLRKGGFHYKKVHLGAEDAINPLTKPTNIDKGSLHVVSVPIGNLKDFTYRAIDILRDVDYIVTTDRPATKTLLDLISIPSQGRLIHYSASNRSITQDKLVELLKGGRSMALVTTSGTPCVGDVGSDLVRAMQAEGVRVTSVPGASALLSALVISGVTLSPHERPFSEDNQKRSQISDVARNGSFYFGNMLPDASTARLQIIRNVVASSHHPCVFYEIPRRLLSVLQDIASIVPRRRVYVAHELTKMNESLHADTAENLVLFYLRQEAATLLKLGQIVIVVAGADSAEIESWVLREMEKRRRLRKDVSELMQTPTQSSTPNVVDEKGTGQKRATSKRRKIALKKKLRRKKREKLIRQIEKEQERLRLNMTINKNDANKF